LLNHLGIKTRLTSYHQHNWRARLPHLLEALASGDVALVADSGMPVVSDPGSHLVAGAAVAGFPVEVVPGVSSITAALAVSGFNADTFFFEGFLPRRSNERRARLRSAGLLPVTLVLFEAPHRLRATLADILVELGDREVAVCRELTKLHQEVFRGTVSQALEHFQVPLGEFVLVVQGAPGGGPPAGPSAAQLEEARRQLAALRAEGTRGRDAVTRVAEALGLPKNAVYRLWLETGRRRS
jgi:16S rRNA (cytidine1402-2'-O)-methyltransferase